MNIIGNDLLLCGFCYFELLSLRDSLDEMAAMVSQFPRLIMIMFGVKGDLTTSTGWYVCIYFWEGLLAFPYAMSLGLSCVAKEKKFGTSETSMAFCLIGAYMQMVCRFCGKTTVSS